MSPLDDAHGWFWDRDDVSPKLLYKDFLVYGFESVATHTGGM